MPVILALLIWKLGHREVKVNQQNAKSASNTSGRSHYTPAPGHRCPLLSRVVAGFPALAAHPSFAISCRSHYYRALVQLCCSQSLLSLFSFTRFLQESPLLHGWLFPGKLIRKLAASRICSLDDPLLHRENVEQIAGKTTIFLRQVTEASQMYRTARTIRN